MKDPTQFRILSRSIELARERPNTCERARVFNIQEARYIRSTT
jgi:hypothetical protein